MEAKGNITKNEKYPYSSEEILMALEDLNSKKLLPIHNSKFKLSKHAWYEPLDRLDGLTKDTDIIFRLHL